MRSLKQTSSEKVIGLALIALNVFIVAVSVDTAWAILNLGAVMFGCYFLGEQRV